MLHNLTDLTQDSQIQQEHLLALRRLIDLRLAQLKEAIDLRNAGRIEANEQIVRQHAGKETMDKILMVLGKMRDQRAGSVDQLVEAGRQGGLVHVRARYRRNLRDPCACYRRRSADLYDLSRRRRVERELLAGARPAKTLILRTLPVVMYSAKPSGDYGALWVSENIEALTGFSPRLFLDDSSFWASRLHPHDRKRALHGIEKLPQESTLATEYRWQTRNGAVPLVSRRRRC